MYDYYEEIHKNQKNFRFMCQIFNVEYISHLDRNFIYVEIIFTKKILLTINIEYEHLQKQDSSGKKEITVLDPKRSNGINIGLTVLPPPRTIKAAILKMDNSIMNKEGIEVNTNKK